MNILNRKSSGEKPDPDKAINDLRLYLLRRIVPASLEAHVVGIIETYDSSRRRKKRKAAVREASILVGIISTFGTAPPPNTPRAFTRGNYPQQPVGSPYEQIGSITMAFRPNQDPDVLRDMVNLVLIKAGVSLIPLPADETVAIHYGVDLETTLAAGPLRTLEEALALDALTRSMHNKHT